MVLEIFDNNDMGQNIYLYYDEASSEGVLIDSGCNKEDRYTIESIIRENNITIKAILLTHGHYDHIIGVDELRKLTSATIYCHKAEKQMLENPDLNLSVRFGIEAQVMPDQLLSDEDKFRFGNTTLKVIHTPGHTPGGVCFYDEGNRNLFSGDTLFDDSIGRTDLPSGDHALLVNSINTKLMSLPDDTIVYSGHGAKTTIGKEKKSNQFLK